MNKLFDLSGRTALITGAGGYLCSEMAVGLAEAGASVLLWDSSEEALSRVKLLIPDADIRAIDLLDQHALTLALDQLQAERQTLDIVINGAYAGGAGTSEQATPVDFESAWRISATASFMIAQGLRPLLRHSATQRGATSSVINISSMYGMVSPDVRVYDRPQGANPPFYGAAKAGLLQLTRYWATEFAPDRIRVNAISPGPFPNPRVQAADPDLCARLSNRVPLHRVGQAAELIGPALFLASDASSYVTGHNLVVDGGWTVW
jgi:NAD(P)-dependent dehydrogenase (short-subunit alcohol dehydrogenase family)